MGRIVEARAQANGGESFYTKREENVKAADPGTLKKREHGNAGEGPSLSWMIGMARVLRVEGGPSLGGRDEWDARCPTKSTRDS